MKTRALVFLLVVTVSSSTVVFGADMFSGTWKVNVAKSKFDPGPGLKEQIVTFQAVGTDWKVAVDSTGADGKSTHSEWIGKFDGKDYPMKGDPNIDMRSFKKVDDYTLDIIAKKGGKVLTTTRTVYNKDGKTRVSTHSGVDAQGRQIHNTIVSEKQ
jgi:hypothetical protein